MEKKISIDRIREASEDIKKAVHRLRLLGEKSLEEFLSNEDYQDIARSRLLIAIEASINICYHIVAKKLRRVPDEYGQCFKILGEEGLISKGLAERLSLMCGFRNRLVHLYWKIDYQLVYKVIHSHLSDLELFVDEINAFIFK